MTDKRDLDALHGDEPDARARAPVDALRAATLAVLTVFALLSAGQAVFLVTSVQDQRQVNECYQEQIDALTKWANAAVQAGRTDRQAQRELLLAQINNIGGGDAAIQRYLGQLDEADRTRQRAPVPEQNCTR